MKNIIERTNYHPIIVQDGEATPSDTITQTETK